MISAGQWGSVMIGRGYAIFDTAVGRCGIVWSNAGVLCVQLPEAREIDTRRRLYRLHPDAREARPPLNTEIAIEGIASILRGQHHDLAEVALDWTPSPISTSASTISSAPFHAAKPAPITRWPD